MLEDKFVYGIFREPREYSQRGNCHYYKKVYFSIFLLCLFFFASIIIVHHYDYVG